MNPTPRPLRLGSFAISDGRAVALDDAAPIVIEVDIETGALLAAHTWTVPPFTGRPVSADVEVVGDSIVIASPAAGGVVQIDRATGAVTVIPLDAPIGRLIVDGAAVWAIADPNWLEGTDDEPIGRRPVVWEEPTAEQIAEHRSNLSRWQGYAPETDGARRFVVLGDTPEPDIDWRSEPDDGTDLIDPPTPAWRIRAGVAERVDFGGQLGDLVPLGDRVVAVCILPTDPHVKRIGFGSLRHYSPASVLLGTPSAGFERVGAVAEFGASVSVSGDRIWIIDTDELDRDEPSLRFLDPVAGIVEHPMPLDVEEPFAVIGDRLTELAWKREPDAPRHDMQRVLRLVPLDGRPATTIPIPEVEVWSEEEKIVGRTIWFRKREEPVVVGIETDTGAVREVRIDVDCSPYLPTRAPAEADSPQTMTVPVMLDSGELACCQPHAFVGEPWSASLLLGEAEAWWHEYATDPVPEAVRRFGVVEFDGTVLRAARDAERAGLVATGPIRVAVVGVTEGQQHFCGVLDHDVHGMAEGVLASENECTGIVRRIQGLKYQREYRVEDGERVGVPIAQDPPVDLRSTIEPGFDTYVLTIEFAPGATV